MKKNYIIKNPFGLQASPARLIAIKARSFPASVTIEIKGSIYDAKSLVQLLSAKAQYGDVVTVIAEDHQAAIEVVEAIGELLTAVKPRDYSSI